VLSERFQWLVNQKSGAIGGKFEEDAAWFSEVDRVEVVPVHDRTGISSGLDEFLKPLFLLRVVSISECDVVNGSGRTLGFGHGRVSIYVHPRLTNSKPSVASFG
jgi:hypothetical protein